MNNLNEVDHYPEIAKKIKELVLDNLPPNTALKVYPLIGEVKSGLRTLLVNEGIKSKAAERFALALDTLNLDISLFILDKATDRFELVIIEVKKVSALGLTELSQLIGYCLVAGSRLGLLVNIDNLTSSRFATLLENDVDLTKIERIYRGKSVVHKFGVMKWDSALKQFEYTNSGAIVSIPQLVKLLTDSLNSGR